MSEFVCALRSVCRKHELIQYELEMAAQDLAQKKQQKEELATGVTHFHTHTLAYNLSFSSHDMCKLRTRSGRVFKNTVVIQIVVNII